MRWTINACMVDRLEVIALFITSLIAATAAWKCKQVGCSAVQQNRAIVRRKSLQLTVVCVVLSRQSEETFVRLWWKLKSSSPYWSATMPPKRSVRAAQKGRRSRNFPTTQSIASTPSARRNAPKTPGRTTKNSTGNRGRKTTRRTPIPKVNGRGRRGASGRKDPNPLDEPNCYKAENGEVYRPGGNLHCSAKLECMHFQHMHLLC